MYAVIRAGGKQYRVAPGDVIRVEKRAPGTDGLVEFPDILAVSGGEGKIGKPESGARVVGELVEEGRGAIFWFFTTSARSSIRSCGDTGSLIRRCASPRLLLTGKASRLRSWRRRSPRCTRLRQSSPSLMSLTPRPRRATPRRRLRLRSVRPRNLHQRRRNSFARARCRPDAGYFSKELRADSWHIKKGRALHETGAILTRSALVLRHSAGRSCPAGPSSCGSAAHL